MARKDIASHLLFTVVISCVAIQSKANVIRPLTELGRYERSTPNLGGRSTFCDFIKKPVHMVVIKPYPTTQGQAPFAVAFVKEHAPDIAVLEEKEASRICQSISGISESETPNWLSSRNPNIVDSKLKTHCFSKDVRPSKSSPAFPFKILYRISRNGISFTATAVAYLIPNKTDYLVYSTSTELDNVCTARFGDRTRGQRRILKGSNLADMLNKMKG